MSFKGKPSQTLRETSLFFVNDQKCRSSLTRIIPLYFDSQLCAGYLPGGRDACQVIIVIFFN
jgi:Trypsin